MECSRVKIKNQPTPDKLCCQNYVPNDFLEMNEGLKFEDNLNSEKQVKILKKKIKIFLS